MGTKIFWSTFLCLLMWGSQKSLAQCSPDQTMSTSTNYPTTWKKGCVGEPYNETVYLSFPIDTVVSGVNVVMDHFEIVASNLPPGLTYTTNVGTNTWTPNNTPTSVELIFGCINISGTPTATFSGPATFSIEGCGTVIVITQCSTEVASFNVEIIAPPTPAFAKMINQNVVTFTDMTMTSDTITSYYWGFGDGTTDTSANPVHTYAGAGSYNVCLSVVTGGGCASQACDSVTITSVDVAEAALFARNVAVFPNPAQDQVRVRLRQASQPMIQLRSIEGRLLREWQFTGSKPGFETELDLTGIAQGLYFLNIKAKEGNVVKTLRIE